jgi:hypothetical protein
MPRRCLAQNATLGVSSQREGGEGEREREREKERETDRQTDRHTEKERKKKGWGGSHVRSTILYFFQNIRFFVFCFGVLITVLLFDIWQAIAGQDHPQHSLLP